MDTACLNYIKKIVATYTIKEPIVDFGGATVLPKFYGAVRNVFQGKDYKVFDMSGRDVDIIGDIYNIDMSDASIATALCLNTLEHLAEPQKAIDEMARVLMPGGRIIITAPMAWGIHRYPKDYWRFLPDGMEYMLREKFDNIEMNRDSKKQMNRTLYTTAKRI